MKTLSNHRLFTIVMVIFGGVCLESAVLAQASERDEIRFVQEAVKILYSQDKEQTFTVQEILDDGYKMCEKIADSGGLENLAEEVISTSLGREERQEQDNPEMAKAAEKYLCES